MSTSPAKIPEDNHQSNSPNSQEPHKTNLVAINQDATQDLPDADRDAEKRENAVKLLFGGGALIIIAIASYFQLSALDAKGGETEVHVVVAILYNNLGTIGTTAILGIAGVVALLFGAKGLWGKGS